MPSARSRSVSGKTQLRFLVASSVLHRPSVVDHVCLAPGELAEDQLALAEQAVVALGRRTQLVQRNLALVLDRDLEVERLAGHPDVVFFVGGDGDGDRARAFVLALGPVDAELLQLGLGAAHFLGPRRFDHRLGVAQQLAAAGTLGLNQELAREPRQELVLAFVFLEVFRPGFAQAFARFFRQVVADHVRRLLAVVRAAMRQVRGQVRLAQVTGVHEQIHVVGADGHRLDLDVGHDADALD